MKEELEQKVQLPSITDKREICDKDGKKVAG